MTAYIETQQTGQTSYMLSSMLAAIICMHSAALAVSIAVWRARIAAIWCIVAVFSMARCWYDSALMAYREASDGRLSS